MPAPLGFPKLKWLNDGGTARYPAPMIRTSYKSRREGRDKPSAPGTKQTRWIAYLSAYIQCQGLSGYDMQLLANCQTLLNPRVVLNNSSASIKDKMTTFYGTWYVEDITVEADGWGHDTVSFTMRQEGTWVDV